MNCEKCGRRIFERTETYWNYVHGWEKKREDGGTNHLALREPQDKYCCNGCMMLMQSGLDPGQQALSV